MGRKMKAISTISLGKRAVLCLSASIGLGLLLGSEAGAETSVVYDVQSSGIRAIHQVLSEATVYGTSPQRTAEVTFVSADGFTIEATITAPGGGRRGIRVWDVRVTHPDGSTGTRTAAFTVIR